MNLDNFIKKHNLMERWAETLDGYSRPAALARRKKAHQDFQAYREEFIPEDTARGLACGMLHGSEQNIGADHWHVEADYSHSRDY
jgi:hypothetical protein